MKNTTKQKLLALFGDKNDADILAFIELGFLSDLLSSDLGTVDRRKFKIFLGLEREIPKVQVHRFNVRNLDPDDDLVQEEIEAMFGDVEIVNWYCETPMHGEGLVAGGGMMPQRSTPVVVEYRHK